MGLLACSIAIYSAVIIEDEQVVVNVSIPALSNYIRAAMRFFQRITKSLYIPLRRVIVIHGQELVAPGKLRAYRKMLIGSPFFSGGMR